MISNIDLNSDNAYCISINMERYQYLCNNFTSVGLRHPKYFKGIRWNKGSNTGCVLSHLSILETNLFLNTEYCIVYEDDAFPRPNVLWYFERFKKYIPEDWGILKIGSSSYRGEYIPVNQFFGYMKSGTAFGSHCYIVRNDVYKQLIDNMVKKWIPDGAMDWDLYKSHKPYVLDRKYQIYIQKNITCDNIISRKGGQRYWFPHPTQQNGCTSGFPCKGFVDKLYDDDPYANTDIVVLIYKDKKITCSIQNNIIEIKGLKGKFIDNGNELSYAMWDNNTYSKMKFLQNSHGTRYYNILD